MGSEKTYMTIKGPCRRTSFLRGIPLSMVAAILSAAPAAVLAQAVPPAATAPLLGADGKTLTFDVVSIREHNPEDTAHNTVQNGPTPDGYRLKDAPLFAAIQTAYLPSEGGYSFRPDRVTGMPAWVFGSNTVLYDIDAKVSEADLPRWKDPAQQPAMLRAMLQAMLADRFKLAIHATPRRFPSMSWRSAKRVRSSSPLRQPRRPKSGRSIPKPSCCLAVRS